MDIYTILAGIVAYGVSVLASVALVFGTYRLNSIITTKIDEEQFLLSGNRSIAIALGSIILCQSILLRHAVFPTMVVVRDLFLQPVTTAAAVWVLAHCLLFFVIISVLSFSSVIVASWFFTKMTRRLPEKEEIRKDNVAVAIFFAFSMIAITLIVNEGLEDLSRSIIPYRHSGVLRLP